MKNKYKIIFIVLLATIVQFSFQGCQKYPDGPLVSFRTKTERVANTWNIDNYKINGTDFTSLVTGYSETYTTEGEYSFIWESVSGTGSWEFENDFEDIKLTGIDNQSSHTLHILKLEEKQFWYYYMDGNDRKEFHMVQQ